MIASMGCFSLMQKNCITFGEINSPQINRSDYFPLWEMDDYDGWENNFFESPINFANNRIPLCQVNGEIKEFVLTDKISVNEFRYDDIRRLPFTGRV